MKKFVSKSVVILSFFLSSISSATVQKVSAVQFKDFVKELPVVSLPLKFDLNSHQKKVFHKKIMTQNMSQKHICPANQITCKSKMEIFALGKFIISRDAIAVVYHSIADQDVQTFLLTYDTQFKIKGAVILSASYGDMEWGYFSSLTQDFKMQRIHYVWVKASEKEYVKDENFQIEKDGEIRFVINPST